MAKIVWDAEGYKRFETGVDHGVLYPKASSAVALPGNPSLGTTHFTNGVAWNGLTSVSKSPSGAEANDIYADNIKYASLRSAETFGATIEAYTYPNEFMECNGLAVVEGGLLIGQQIRKSFGFCFRTDIGDDTDNGIDVGSKYKLHLVYNATASPSEESFSTINDSPEAITFSWEISTIPYTFADDSHLPLACITIDSTKANSTNLKKLEDILYGENGTPMLPEPAEVIAIFS